MITQPQLCAWYLKHLKKKHELFTGLHKKRCQCQSIWKYSSLRKLKNAKVLGLSMIIQNIYILLLMLLLFIAIFSVLVSFIFFFKEKYHGIFALSIRIMLTYISVNIWTFCLSFSFSVNIVCLSFSLSLFLCVSFSFSFYIHTYKYQYIWRPQHRHCLFILNITWVCALSHKCICRCYLC